MGETDSRVYRIYYNISDVTDHKSVYAIYGRDGSPLILPPCIHTSPPFGADIGGVSSTLFTVDADAEFDSWLTLGNAEGPAGPPQLTHIGIDFSRWDDTTGIDASNGAVFNMQPDQGPTSALPTSTGEPGILLAQLNVPNALGSTDRSIMIHLQGELNAGGDWNQSFAFALPK